MLTKEEMREKMHRICSEMTQQIQQIKVIEAEYPGYMRYIGTLHAREITRSLNHESLKPADILEAAENFEDMEKAKDVWYQPFQNSIVLYLTQEMQ